MDKVKHGEKMAPASEAGQMPPTESNPVRQRYQMGCGHGSGGETGGSGSNYSSRIPGGYLRMRSRPRRY